MTWLAPGFLAGLLLLGIPWWLHRRESKSPERELFPSTMLFKASAKRLLVAKRIRHRWLLAARLALLALLALLFAEPYLFQTKQPADEGQTALLVIDDSFSMRGVDLVDLSAPLVANAAATTRWHVVSTGGAWHDLAASEVLTLVASITPGYARVELGALMRRAVRQTEAGTPAFVVTDAQASAAPARFSDLLPGGVGRITLSDRPEPRDNAWLASLTIEANEAIAVAGGNVDSAQVVWRIGGEVVATSAMEEGRARLTLPDLPPAQHALQAVLRHDDALAADNTLHAVIDRSPPTAVPILTTTSATGLPYFQAALATLPHRLVAQPIAIREFDGRTATRYQWIIAEDPDQLDATQVEHLTDFVERGGRLLLLAGSDEFAESATALHGLQITGHSNVSAGAVAENLEHPLVGHAASWRAVQVFRHANVVASDNHQTIVSLLNGAPLLVSRQLGRGEVITLTTQLGQDWSDLGSRAAFLALLRAIAVQTHGELNDRSFTTGAPLPPRTGSQVIAPDGRRIERATDGSIVLDIPGVYTVYSEAGTRLIPVNVDRRESELTVMPESLMTRWQQPSLESEAAVPARAMMSDESQPGQRAIWPLLLILLVGIMMLEPILANLTRSTNVRSAGG